MLIIITVAWIVFGFVVVSFALYRKTVCPTWQALAVVWCGLTLLIWLVAGVWMYGGLFGQGQ